ncbi:MAG: histidine kinase [Burkholderiales bacterium]
MTASSLPRGFVSRIEVPAAHVLIACALALAWGLANTLGWSLGHGTDDLARTGAHFVLEALLPMLALVATLGVADAVARNEDAVAPYAIAAVTAAIGGEIAFIALAPLVGLDRCGCNMDHWPPGARTANMLPDSLLICGFITAGYRYRQRSAGRLARLNADELEGAQLIRRTQESRLQAMQACIEPQFLFDTLAAVRQIHAEQPVTAARLVDELIIYLRAALPHLRESTSTVAKEADLAHAWINIHRLRDGHGPDFAVDLGAAGSAQMPPMVLLPVVDYAFAGVAAGGTLRIAVRTLPRSLRFEVETTGGGRDAGAAAAAKLAALRARLDTLYGDDARLAHGSRGDIAFVTLDIPHDHDHGPHR